MSERGNDSSGARDEPPSRVRRGLLLGLAGGAIGFGAGRAGAMDQPAEGDRVLGGENRPDPAGDSTLQAQPFYGPHQSGIVTAQPAAALMVSFDVIASSRGELERLLRTLTARIAFLMSGGPVPAADPKFPPLDSGLLGPNVFPDNLTVTVALGASLFDTRYDLAPAKPKHLVAMERFPNDSLDAKSCHGDLLLQFCSNTAETNIHALRDIIKHTPDLMTPRWKIDGFLPPHTIKKMGKDTVRNLLGFKDGTANLNSRDADLMDRHVWVGKASEEPAWASGGTYQVVRVIRMLVERWDRTPLGEQQTIIGREKMSGSPLTLANEHDAPDYKSDPEGRRIPLDAHIRLANPRTPETESSLILRRGYNFSRGLTNAGQLDMGLIFVCFQSNLSAGFRAVQRRLNREPLEEYIKPVGGGYFFVLPGVDANGKFLGQGMLETTA